MADVVRGLAFGPQVWKYVRDRITLEQAQGELHRRLASREVNFLRSLREGVYANPDSPYLRLLEWAGCEYGDVERMVAERGLEPTLGALHDAGVYVTFDEFKGRAPIVRHGRTLTVHPDAFNNPGAGQPYFHGGTGGSTGASVRVPMTFDHHRETAVNNMLYEQAHGVLGTRSASWFSSPDAIAMLAMMGNLAIGKVPDAWFAPPKQRPSTIPWPRRAFVWYFLLACRAAGVRVPKPRPVGLDQAEVVARWAARTRDEHGAAMLTGYVSQMVRVAVAALDAGLDLTGVTIMGGSEPPTPAKVATITSTGARWAANYWSIDAGAIGFGCARAVDENDLHFQRDRLALIQRPQAVPASELTVDAFCFTSLLPTVPKVLLNTETDDYGIVEQRDCGCLLQEYGLVDHIRQVRSYRKLTGEGITLVGGDMERILEDVLPARFGGSALDYQLAEEEDDQGLTRMYLVVSPRVSIDDEQAVVSAVLEALEGMDRVASTTAAVWKQAGTLRVRRQEPVRTRAGKLMPLHVNRQTRPAEASAMQGGG